MGQGTLIVLTLRDFLGVPPATIMLATAAGAAAAVIAGPWWGRLADRHGSAVVQLMSGWILGAALLGLSVMRRGASPAYGAILVYMLATLGYCGFFVASNRGMLHRMRPRIGASYASFWLAITSIAAGISTVVVGQCLDLGGDAGYYGTALAYGALLCVAATRCATLQEKGATFGAEMRLLYEPSRPFWSVARMCWFVINPPPNGARSEATQGHPRTTPPSP
jgi:MFS family permease